MNTVTRWIDLRALDLIEPTGAPPLEFTEPLGEEALVGPDSVSWRMFKNPVALLVGGIAAVILELGEPRVRTGVWEHTSFRTKPMERLRGTARAAMMTVYGPRSKSEPMIARVVRMHDRIAGVTPDGVPYRASDPELLDWVHTTASWGLVEATHAYVRPVGMAERDRYHAEAKLAGRLFGVASAAGSHQEHVARLDRMRNVLQPSPIVHEFLDIMQGAPIAPELLRFSQRTFVRAGIALLPIWMRERFELGREWDLRPWERRLVATAARAADRLALPSSPAVLSCRRLGLRDDYLFRDHSAR